MKVLLVGNYLPDRQESMQRFAGMMAEGLQAAGVEVRTIRPEPFFGKLKQAKAGIGKWLGYLDKFFVFPGQLKKAARWADVVHVCDHSNAFYSNRCGGKPCVVTCHDLLAVRGGLGEDTDCPASFAGRYLQLWILKGLRNAAAAACDSAFTWEDLKRLAGDEIAQRSPVVLLGLNQPFKTIGSDETWERLAGVSSVSKEVPFVLQVGQNLRRKNRDGVLRVMKLAVDKGWEGRLVFAGFPLNDELKKLRDELGLKDRVIEVVKPPHDVLEALMNAAHAMLFPSRFEGFGWPVIEAQASGCPVICSDRTSLPEVAGAGAVVCDLDDEAGMADAILALQDQATRESLVARGYENLKRFGTDRMMDEYVQLYRKVSATL